MRRHADDPPFVVELLEEETPAAPVVVDRRTRPRLAPLVAAAVVVALAAVAGSAFWSRPAPRPPAPDLPEFEEEVTARLDRCGPTPVRGAATACVRWATPGVVGGVAGPFVFTTDGRWLRAHDRLTGGAGWSRELEGEVSMVAAGESVVTTDRLVPERMTLTVFEAADGRERWQASVGGTFGAPVIGGGLVVVHDRERVIAFDEADGDRRWSFDVDAGISAPALAADDGVVFGTNDGTLRSLDVASGTPRWTTQLPSRLRHPAVALGDAVVVASASGLVGLDRTTGEVVWTRRPAYPPGWLATVDDVIVVESGPALVGLDDDHGGERWRTRLPAVPAEEAAGDGVVYLAVNRTLIAIETRGGRVQWRVPLYGQWPVTASAASAEGLFVGIDGEVVALS